MFCFSCFSPFVHVGIICSIKHWHWILYVAAPNLQRGIPVTKGDQWALATAAAQGGALATAAAQGGALHHPREGAVDQAGVLHQGNAMAQITAWAQGELTAVAQQITSAVTSLRWPMVVAQAPGTPKKMATSTFPPEEVHPPEMVFDIFPMFMDHPKHPYDWIWYQSFQCQL